LKPLATFENAIKRAQYFCKLYDLLHNRRTNKVKRSWAVKCNNFFRWNENELLTRIDGNSAVLLIHGNSDFNMQHFKHEYLGELSRAALTFGVSALDRYMHDIVEHYAISMLAGPFTDIPKSLGDFSMPLKVTEQCLKKALESRNREAYAKTRPRIILRQKFREALNKKTFQKYEDISNAFGLLNLNNPWDNIATEMNISSVILKKRINSITHRRNKIVHEGDIQHGHKRKKIKLNDIKHNDTVEDIKWLDAFVKAIDKMVLSQRS
jgi:hypothetical protein